MENFTYWAPTKYVFGRDTESRVGELAASFGMKKILVVYGGGSAVRSGLLGRVEKYLADAGIEAVSLGGVKPNPEDDLVYKGIDLARAEGVDSMIAVGGGSVIDTAKAIAVGVPYQGDFWDFYSGKAKATTALPVGVVLTIPAAGSEGSGNSVITKREGRIKTGLRTESVLRPRFAVLDPVLTFTLPPYQTASGISDMMAHIMERYFSNTPDVEVTDRLCEGLLRAIIEESPKVMANPEDYQARANIMWAGTLAHNGICGCGRQEEWTSHAMEHEISAVYGVTHGAGLAVVFPAWLRFMADRNPGKVAQFARRVFSVEAHDDRAAALEGILALQTFFSDTLNLPVSFAALGIENPDIDLLSDRLHALKGNPTGSYYPLTPADSRMIYQMML